MTYLCCIAYCTHNESARTSQHHRTAKHLIFCISLVGLVDILISYGILGKLVRHWLTRQARFIHLQVGGLIQQSISRYLIARLHKNNVANNHLATRNLHDCSLSNHLNRLFLTQLRQHIELAGSIALKVKANGSSQYDSSNNADSLNEITLYEGQDKRHYGSNQQDAHHRVLIFLHIQLPHRGPTRWRQHILTMLRPTLFDLNSGQSLLLFFHIACKVTTFYLFSQK